MWLQGRCEAADCPLQHKQQPDLMPVCTFFLQVQVSACTSSDSQHTWRDPSVAWCP